MHPLIIGLSVGIVALAFVVLVVYLCFVLMSLRKTLETSNKLLKDTRIVIDDLQMKVHAFDPVFRTISSVGSVVEKKVSSATDEIIEGERSKMGMVTDALEWAILGVTLFQKFKEKRR